MGKVYEQAQKELKRIEKIARRIEKRGYVFDLPFGKTKGGLEKKRYTEKELEQLKKIHAKDLYKYAKAFGYSGEEYRKIERQKAYEKGRKNRELRQKLTPDQSSRIFGVGIYKTIIDNFIESGWAHLTEIGKAKVKQYLDSKIAIYGESIVASVLEEATKEGIAVMLKQQAYDFNVQISLYGEAGLEQYFANVYDTEAEAEEQNRYAKDLQSEMDDYEYDYPDELLPFNFYEE